MSTTLCASLEQSRGLAYVPCRLQLIRSPVVLYVLEMGRAWQPVCKLSQTRCFAASRPTSTLPGEAAE